MTILDHSTVQEYARQFWRRESEKGNQDGIHTFADIERGADPVEALRVKHSYKLPRPENSHVCIAAFTSREEIENLLVHEYMPNDKWMQERELVPSPFTQRLGTLARICLDRGYFTSHRDDRQIRHYQTWKKKGLREVISNNERPLVEASDSGNIEIVDGWGRLLPIAALLLEGLAFETIQVFYASPSTKHTYLCATANT